MLGRWGRALNVVMGLVLLCQQSVWGSQQNELPQTKEATVRFNLYKDYLIVVHGSVGPLKGLNFLLDTGTSPTILDERVASKLQLEEEPASISSLEGSLRGEMATVPSLEFGPMRRENFPVLVRDLSFFGRSLPVRIDAVIGLDVLGKNSFLVDYRARQIEFGPHSPMPISIPFRDITGLAVIEVELNHSPVRLLVDTGASALILFEARLSVSVPSLSTGAVRRVTNMVGQIESRPVQLNSLKLGDEELRQETAYVVSSRNGVQQAFDGLISPSALGFTRVAVDFEQGVMGFGY